MIQQAIGKAVSGVSLTGEEARAAMEEIMTGAATPVQVAGYLTALRMKGETVDEITESARVMREHALAVPGGEDALDIVGTGGDSSFTFNISTASAFVAAGAGVKVAKHGNRSVSSKCGAADVLEALGARLDLSPEQAGEVLRRTGICFLFAPAHHQSMKYAAAPRKELGIRTIFNILGPLANPAGAGYELLGVYDPALAQPLCRVLRNLGVRRAMAVCGETGAGTGGAGAYADELTLCGKNTVCELKDGAVRAFSLSPADFGLPACTLAEIQGGGAARNAQLLRAVLSGEKGPRRDTVLANAGAALYLTGRAETPRGGAELAAGAVDSGRALAKLDAFVAATREV